MGLQRDRAADRALLVVDASVEDRGVLLAGLADSVDVIVADPSGLADLAAKIGAHAPVDSLHILTHGEPGAITLGGNRIDAAQLQQGAPIAEALAGLLGAGTRLALWACSAGASSVGQAFVGALGALTGARVFASQHPVGASAAGGTWDIGTLSPFSGRAMAAYPHTLPAANEDFDSITAQIVSNTDHFNNDSTTDWNFRQGTDAQIAIAGNANGGTFTNGLSNDGSGDRILFLNYNGLTSNNTAFDFEQSDGDHFQLDSFQLGNNLAGYSTSVTITVLNGATTVGTATIDLNTTSTSNGITYTYGGDSSGGSARPYGTLTFDATYGDVDKVELVYSGAATPIIDNIVVSAPNSAPTIDAIPTDVTVTEDVASNFDLSSLNMTDVDDDTLTVTLNIDAGTFTSVADGAGSGVTETLVSGTEITLVGTATQIETYLSDTSVIKYQGASNVNGNNAAGLTVSVTDSAHAASPVQDTANIDITPVNDPATFGGDTVGSIYEDAVSVSGTATVADIDSAATFNADTITGSHGSLTIAANGDWVYSLDNTDSTVQALAAGDTLGDTVTAASADGTTQDIVITITGVNDAAVFSGNTTGAITEGDSTIGGDLNVTDVDGLDSLTADTVSGSYGSLTIDTAGGWVYTLDNNSSAVTDLNTGQSLQDTLTVSSADGTTQDIVVTINGVTGANQAPSAPSLTSDGVEENFAGALVGTLSSTDPEGETVTFEVHDDRFVVSGNQLYLQDGVSLDYETATSIDLRLYAHDPEGLYSSSFVTIPVLNVVNENVGGGTNGNDTVTGTAGSDTITGGSGNDVIDGGAGNDVITKPEGDTGTDVLVGGEGNDRISAGGGNDFVVGDGATDGHTQQTLDQNSDPNSDGQDTIRGGDGDDTLLGGGWNDDAVNDNGVYDPGEETGTGTQPNFIWAGAGNDIAIGAGGGDEIGGGSGNDTIKGLSGDDTLYGNSGDDSILGGDGNDVIYNGAGSDVVQGGNGDDTIWASAGDDTLTGGDGADTFVFGGTNGNDTITDFNVDEDSLDFTWYGGFSSADDVTAAASETTQGGESGVLIDLGNDESVFLQGITLDDLSGASMTL